MAKIPGKTEKLIPCTYKFMVLVCIWPSKHVICDTQVSGFLLVLWFLPPIKMTATIQLKYYWKWFSPGTLVSSTNKNDSHDTTEILSKVVLNNFFSNKTQSVKIWGLGLSYVICLIHCCIRFIMTYDWLTTYLF
jgi:hypothetical protein